MPGKIKLVSDGSREWEKKNQAERETAQPVENKNRIKLVSDGTRDWTGGTRKNPVVTQQQKQEAENLYQRFVREAREKKPNGGMGESLVKGDFTGDRVTAQEKPDWGKIAGGTFIQGMDQFAQGGAATLAAFEGIVSKPLGYVLGNNELYKDGLFYNWNEKIKEEQQQAADYFAPEYEKAGKAGEIIQKFGPSTVAAIPQAALAFFTAGQSLAAQGTTAGLQGISAAAQGAGIAQAANAAMQGAAKNPQFWASFMTTAGNEYEQAKADGADDLKAYAYGTITGLLNSLVEIGGGIDTLPDGSKKAVRKWVETMLDEGKEEMIQGAISQMSQVAVYGKQNPFYSTTDENAVINPKRALEEFLGGAVVGGILGGGQIGVQRAMNALGEAGARARAKNQGQVQEQGTNQEAGAGLTLTMPEELVQPGDWQTIRNRQEAEARDGGAQGRYSIHYDKDNRPFVTVEEDILEGVPEDQWVKTVKENLRKKFPTGITVGNNEIIINNQSRREMTFSRYMQRLMRADRQLFADKLRATNNADEILRASRNWVNEALLHPRNDAIIDFARGEVLLRVGDQDYTAQVIVGNRGGGNLLLYDVIDLKPATIQERMRETGADNTTKPTEGTGSRQSAPVSQNSIPQSNTESNRNIPYEGRDDTGLTLTMPEELVQPGDYQMVQARQNTVTDQVRQRIENEEGATINAENDAGGIGSNGQSQLDPGGQNAGVPGAAGTAESGRGQSYRARDLGAALDAANAPLISAREFFGDTNLSEDSYVREVPQDLIDTDEGLRTVAQKIRDTGYTPRLYSGNVRQAGGNLQVNGMISDTDVFIRVDSVRYTPEQIWDHEMYHIAADKDPAIVKQAAAKLMKEFGADIPNQVLARYIEAYKGVYTGRDLTMAAMEEMLADAYAGKDTFRQEVGRFTDTVRQITPQATQETNAARGPPRYSTGGDTGLVLGMPEDLRQESDWIVQQEQSQTERELRQGQERDMMAQTNTQNGEETSYERERADQQPRAESREDFIRRRNAEGYTIVTGRGGYFGYRPVPREFAKENARQVQKELANLGVDAEVIEGTAFWNFEGITISREIPQAATFDNKKIIINNSTDLNPKNMAGHEAFHLWKGSQREQYIETLKDNLIFSNDNFVYYQSDISNTYFGEDTDLGNTDANRKFMEELFAYLSGDIHEGAYDEYLRPMFRDYDAVKTAWENLVSEMRSENKARYSMEESRDLLRQIEILQKQNQRLKEEMKRTDAPRLNRNAVEKQAGELRQGQERDMMAQTNTQNGEETSYERERADQPPRAESREDFIRRSHAEGYTVVAGRRGAFGYRPVRVGIEGHSGKIQEELRSLGVNSAITEGPVQWNMNGITGIREIREATTVDGEIILISSNVDMPVKQVAGHEAFHFWKENPARDRYIDTVQENLIFTSPDFQQYQSALANDYFGGDVDLDDSAKNQKFMEELFAYLSGDIHEGTYDEYMRPMFRDYDAVKAAWESLVSEMSGKDKVDSTGDIRYSAEEDNQGQKLTEEQEEFFRDSQVRYGRLNEADIRAVQSIGRKSVNSFSQEDIKAVEPFARRYWAEMGTKSPFFRAWFGDWRANDQTPVERATEPGADRGQARNEDTGWDINVSGKVFNETRVHNDSYNKAARPYLPYINDIIKKAVLLDSHTMAEGKTKSANSLLMHSLYAVADIGSGPELIKLYVEEMNDPNSADTAKRAYQLQNVEKYRPAAKSSQETVSSISAGADVKSVADLFDAVKRSDGNFQPKAPSAVTDGEGRPLAVYHGTNRDFWSFDPELGAYWFSRAEDYAEALAEERGGDRVMSAYLDIKNPLRVSMPEGVFTDPTAEAPYIRRAKREGYDGVIFEADTENPLAADTFYVVFRPEQIKSATDNVGTFGAGNPDIRYSAEADTSADNQQDMEAETLRKLADLMPGVKRKDLQAIMSDIKGGAIEAQLMANFWDQYENIRVADYTAEAQELQEVKRALQGRKIYADESLKAEFGDDWNDIRKKAFGNRLYFTSQRGDGVSGLDQINQELAGQFPQLFNEADTDPAAIMDNILTVLERSGENTISLDEEAAKYGGSETIKDFRQSYLNQFMDIAREYRDYQIGMEAEKREERRAARKAEREKQDNFVKRVREVLKKQYLENDYSMPALPSWLVDEEGKAVDIDDYVRRKEQEAKAKQEERLRHIPKEDFKGSKNLERLGVKIDGTVTDYFGAEGLRANDQAMRSIKKELRAAEKRLRATAKEKSFASQIVSGELTEADLPATVDRDKVMELADYYMAERAAGTGMIQQRRKDINQLLDERMKAIFKDAPDKKLPGAITLNHRTPERVILSAFGDKEGTKINKALIEPVKRNEAERIRFINRELDKVRTFKDSTGKESALTKEERAAVQQTIEGRAAEEIIAGMEMSEAIKQVGENLKAGESAMDLQLEFPLAENERKLAKQYAKWLEAQEAMDNNKVDRVKVENAAKKYSELFDQYYEAINDFLVVHGYQPIGFIKGYAPHLQPQDVHSTLSNVMRSMGLLDDVSEIPTSIAGLTGDFRPGKKWNPFFLTRQTDNAQQDIAAGFESYIQYLSDVLYHTDDIMRIRAAERYFRKTYAPADIKAQLEQAEDLRWMPQEDKEAFLRENDIIKPGDQLTGQQVHQILQDYIDQQYRTLEEKGKYSNLAPWLQNYANILAGKQTWADRSWESSVGRKGMNVANKVMRALTRSQVAGNISTVLNQTAQLPQIIADAGTVNTAQAMRDMINGRLRRTGFAAESDFLTNKKGIEYLVNTPGEMVTSALFKPAAFMDEMISTLATRSGYLKAIKEGKSDADAMRYADSFAEKVMGSRAKGSRPLAFENKNILSQMVHLYQIEALNSWEHLTQDLPRDFREIQNTQGKDKAALALAGVIVKMLLSAFLLNRAAEETYGGTPAPYDLLGLTANFIASGEGLTANQWLLQVIDNGTEKLGGERIFGTTQEEPREFDWGAAADDAAYQIMGDLPLVRNVAGLLGVGDQTQVWSGLGDAVTNTGKAITEDGLFSGRTAEELFLLAAQLIPGGNQARKSYQGAKALLQGGRTYGYGENARMQYPVERTPGNIARGLLFGQSALPESREFYAGGAEGGLSAKQTGLLEDLVEAGADNQEAFDVIQNMKESSRTTDKLMELAEAPWDEDVKEIAAESFMGESQMERYMAARKANVSTLDYADFLKDAYENAQKRTGKDTASPSQADVESALNRSGLSRSQKRAIWNSYGWKAESQW